MRVHVKSMILRGVLGLALCFGMGAKSVYAQCAPTSPTVALARAFTLPSHTLSLPKMTPGQWTPVGTYPISQIEVMGPECGSYGLAVKSFMYQGSGAPKVIGFDGMTPIFEIKSNETKVGVAIEVAKAGTGSYKYVASNTTTQYIEYDVGVDRPAIDIRLTEYVKVPSGAQPGVLVAGALYNKNIFYSSWDEINTKGDKKTEVPLQVTLGSIVLQQPTCTISPSEKTKTVNMGSIDPSQFSGVGTKSNEVPFTFVLGNCSEVTEGMHMTFEADMPGTNASVFPTDRPELGLGLISLDSHGASGTGEPIVPNSQIDFDAASGGSYRFKAFLEQLDPGAISPGGVISRVRVLVNYD